MAAYGFVFRTYRTFPVRTEHGIGIGQELVSEEWLPTMRACRDAADVRAWRMNGERVPGSSSGWSGNCRTHSSDPDAPNFDPTAEWFYCFSTRGQELFHGHRFGWVANVSQHGAPLRRPVAPLRLGIYVMDAYAATALDAVVAGPFPDTDAGEAAAAAVRAECNVGADCSLYRFDGFRFALVPESVSLPFYGTAYYRPDDVFVDVHTTDSQARTTITHPQRGVCVVASSTLEDVTPGTLRAN
jgi:hypothetical protein